MLAALVLVLTMVMVAYMSTMPLVLGCACVMVVMASVGLTSLMAGSAATDFGGRKATATCAGIVDGFTYLGSGIQSFFIGQLVPSEKAGAAQTFMGIPRDWHWWPLFMVPFAIIGFAVAIKLWHDLPEATRRFNAERAKAKG